MKVELRDISKSFGSVIANDGISLVVEAGTIHGLLGENGAGKSTLMKVLSGFISAERGQIELNDRPANYHTPAQALALGIGMLHQDPLDFPSLSVLDNFVLGEPTFIQARSLARQKLLDWSTRFDFDLDPDAPLSALTPGERQQLELIRLLARGAEVLILDEPTTGISQPQKLKLFATLKTLAAQGKTIILVSHKLEDVEELCARVTVLRRGKVVGEVSRPFHTSVLVQLMFGQKRAEIFPIDAERPANLTNNQVVLRISGLSVGDHRLKLDDVSFEVRAGEVIGFAGLEGSGQRLALRACGGLLKPTRGSIEVSGRNLAGQPYQKFLESGVAYLPAGRLEEGLVVGLDLSEHFELARRSRDFFINWNRSRTLVNAKINEYNIRGRANSFVEDLSGGNQQRALLALLPPSLNLLLLEQPTRGLDIESAQWVWSQLLSRRKHGTALVFISADFDEVLDYADRVVVFSGGKVNQPMPARGMTVEQIGTLIGGRQLPVNGEQ